MKHLSIIIFLVFVIISCNPKQEQSVHSDGDKQILEKLVFDLNNNGKDDTIILSGKPIEHGEFTNITFLLSNGARETIKASDGWDKIDSLFLQSNKNTVKSKRVFLYKKYNQSIIVLFGFEYGVGRTETSLIRIKNNQIKLLSDRLPKNLITVCDLNNDSIIDLIGRANGELINVYESLNAHTESYNPYKVYSINSDYYLNKQLTKDYNEKYYVFAGYDYDEKILVFCKNDKSEFRIEK